MKLAQINPYIPDDQRIYILFTYTWNFDDNWPHVKPQNNSVNFIQ